MTSSPSETETAAVHPLQEYAERVAAAVGGDGIVTFDTVKVRVPLERWVDALTTARDELGLVFFSWLSAVDWSSEVEVGDPFPEPVDDRFELLATVADVSEGRRVIFSTDLDIAARALGSEVGFFKTRMQLSWYRQLPFDRRTVLALRGLVGLARGFRREAPMLDDGGEPVLDGDGMAIMQTIQDLPASERFFAGGSTTHRGFSVDRLASPETLTPGGFPIGGNGEVLLNTEVRVAIFEALDGVGFVDLGNIFKRAADVSLGDLRPGFGGGLHYRSFVGPIRLELGINPDRRDIVADRRERGYVLHISFGPAF